MRSDSDLHETRTDGEHSETPADFRVSYESLQECADALDWDGPIRSRLDILRKGIKTGVPRWPQGNLVYFIGAADGFVKIGFTKNLTSRLCDLQSANPVPLRVLAYSEGGRYLEREYHQLFADARHFYEWFRLTPEIQAEIDRLNACSVPTRERNIG
jgi:hypothetical protein